MVCLLELKSMANESYYERNKEARCAYQREYYKSNKARINKKRQIDEAVDPEKAKKRLEYNRAYYRKNRKRLLEERAKRYRELKAEREASKKDAENGNMQNLT
jgi:hypothetical protein|tara:strand:- start:149 stop:457 length:309 start_codon:yes stop_codon:yes gene_type:complete